MMRSRAFGALAASFAVWFAACGTGEDVPPGGPNEDGARDAAPSDGPSADGGRADATNEETRDASPDAPDGSGTSDAGSDADAPDAGCTSKTCAQLGLDCGPADDGCGGLIHCGACPGRTVCGAMAPNVCGVPPTCTGLCLQQQRCATDATTTISGTVYAPNGVDPLPNVLVYVPNAPVAPFTAGVHCGGCNSEVSGSPLVSTVTDATGKFKLRDAPVGSNIPLVIQTGRWRRQVTILNVTACVDNPVPAALSRLPGKKSEGDIPLMAVVTGANDALECVLRKVGIQDTEFTNPSGGGRIHLYKGAGAPGAVRDSSTPSETALWGTQAAINQYDMVYFGCEGAAYEKTAQAKQVVVNYANAGGRIFTGHYGYVWLYNIAPFSSTASWNVDQPALFSNDPQTGYVETSFPKGMQLAQWLTLVGASATFGQLPLSMLRDDFTSVVSPTQTWLHINDPLYPGKSMHFAFNTPVGAQPANQCGRVVFTDYHVQEEAAAGKTFPSECAAGPMTPQQKLVEFAIFDLGACVAPPACKPKTCAEQHATCGPAGDGCGNALDCGSCPAGQSCIEGACAPNGSPCSPKTCAQLGYACGSTSDGCGNTLTCGSCSAPAICGALTPGACGGG